MIERPDKAVCKLGVALYLANTCKKLFLSLASETGSTIIYPLLFAGLASGIVLTVGNLFLQQQTLVADLNTKLALTIIRSNFTTIISNDAAWADTLKLATNDSLKCIREGTSCTNALDKVNSIPVLMGPDGTVFYDSQKQSSGLSQDGTSCDGYKPSDYSSKCSYRAEVS